ncbi:MAG: N-formylglutamate amidohydrolase [Eubacteriales bacterium]|nr:N-formylglutamate amidohydrolase [Eubacteriales bacterium]
MTTEQQIDHALAYFTDEEHLCSYELLDGTGRMLISAPHAMLQTRNGSIKSAERFTGMLCRLMHDRIDCPVIYKTRHLRDDANHDPVSDYRDALCRYVKQHDIQFVLDLHQMKPERETDVCIGTGRGHNLMGHAALTHLIVEEFRSRGVKHITIDDPFPAVAPNTVAATVASRCHIPAIQLELNTRLLMNGYDEYCFVKVLDALCELTQRLNRQTDKAIL